MGDRTITSLWPPRDDVEPEWTSPTAKCRVGSLENQPAVVVGIGFAFSALRWIAFGATIATPGVSFLLAHDQRREVLSLASRPVES